MVCPSSGSSLLGPTITDGSIPADRRALPSRSGVSVPAHTCIECDLRARFENGMSTGQSAELWTVSWPRERMVAFRPRTRQYWKHGIPSRAEEGNGMEALPFRKTTHIPPGRNDERLQWALPGPGRARALSQRPVSAHPEASAARKWVMIRAVTPSMDIPAPPFRASPPTLPTTHLGAGAGVKTLRWIPSRGGA